MNRRMKTGRSPMKEETIAARPVALRGEAAKSEIEERDRSSLFEK